MDLTPPRGTDDLLPPRSTAMRRLYARAARRAELFGYRYVETPAFEGTELFTQTSGESSDVVRKEMYTFEDRGGRMLTLRPEATASIVRAYLRNAHDLPVPWKVYTIGTMWRYSRPQKGRLREFRQFDVEVIGSPEAEADAEVILIAHGYLDQIGMPGVRLELNSVGDENCRPAYREELLAYLESKVDHLRDEHREHFRANPLRVLDCKDEACRTVSAGAPKITERLCGPCKDHFDRVRAALDDEAIRHQIIPTLVRGLDYYTRTAFEFVSSALPEGQGTVCGGGRYDGLAEVLGGPHTPGVGFALGLDRALIAIRENEAGAGPECFVVTVGADAAGVAHRLARALRTAGVSTAEAFGSRPLKAQLKMADRIGARFAVIVGEREATAGTATLRRLSDGRQEEYGVDHVIAHVLSEREPPT